MPSPIVVASAKTDANQGSPTVNVVMPPHSATDLLVTHVTNDNDDGLPSWDGWLTWPGTTANTTGVTYSELRYKIASSGSEVCTLTYGSAPGQMWASCVAVSGHDPSDPSKGASQVDNNLVCALTPDAPNCLMLSFVGSYGPATADAHGYPTGWTGLQKGTNASGWAHGAVAHKTQSGGPTNESVTWENIGYGEDQYLIAIGDTALVVTSGMWGWGGTGAARVEMTPKGW